MKTLVIGAIVSAFVLNSVSGAGTAKAPPLPKPRPEEVVVAKGNTEFALDLYAKLRLEEGNLFLSPYSISSALAMTYAGARARTAEQMARTLHFTLPNDRLHPTFGGLTRGLNDGGKKGDYELAVANALWGQKGEKWLPEFLALNREHYGAGLNEVDFIGATEHARQTINRWGEKETRERIKDLLKPGVLRPNTRLVLTNAIYFKGLWLGQFNEEATRDAPFHLTADKTTTVPMMNQTGPFKYMQDNGFKALELPYKGKRLSMVVFLPDKVDGLAGFEKTLTAESLSKWLSRLRRTPKVIVGLPKFKVTAEFRLGKVLKSLGMTDAFSGAADFSGMNGLKNLFISAVVHKAFVDVNEEGTEAAAATAVVIGRTSVMVRPPPVFRADHPFLFLIRDNVSGCILFLGRVLYPIPRDVYERLMRRAAILDAAWLLPAGTVSHEAIDRLYGEHMAPLKSRDVQALEILAVAVEGERRGYVFKTSGQGPDGPIEGYVGVAPDLAQVVGVSYWQGGPIRKRPFADQFRGKSVRDAEGKVGITFLDSDAERPGSANEVRAISGAERTCAAVATMFNRDLRAFLSVMEAK